MNASAKQLRDDALAIWRAGVDAVRSDRLVMDAVRVEDDNITVGDQVFSDAMSALFAMTP